MKSSYAFRDFCLQFTYYGKLHIFRVSELAMRKGGYAYLVRLPNSRGVLTSHNNEWSLVSNDPLLHKLKKRIIREIKANKVLTHIVRSLYQSRQELKVS